MEKIKTFADACKIEGLDPETVIPNFSCYPEADQKAAEANAKLMIVIKAANRLENNNEEWIPNWEDYNEYKYQPYFVMDEGSSGFRFYDYGHRVTLSCVGSRLCFISRELGEYISTQFIDLYRDLMIK